MIEIEIPGRKKKLEIDHLVLDFNGTLALDGKILPGAADLLRELAGSVKVHIVTAGTFGGVEEQVAGIPCVLKVLSGRGQTRQKAKYVKALGSGRTACIGNGRNDRDMLRAATLGIAVILEEGASTESLLSADIACRDIGSALGLLLNPLRLKATLRS